MRAADPMTADRTDHVEPKRVKTSHPSHQTIRPPCWSSARPDLPAGEPDWTPSHAGNHLVLIQERRVVCVVEGQRLEAACSVARLICRLLTCEILVYACASDDASHLRDDQALPTIPESWRELYRAVPMADAVVGVH